MPFFIWLVLFLVIASFVALMPMLWRRAIYRRYSGSRLVACPENQQTAVVSIDLPHAAATEMDGITELRLCECSRWPESANCGQGCVEQAVRTEPYRSGIAKAATQQIYHLPIVLAAFAAWCMGAFWHSHFMFRDPWMDAVGLGHDQVKQMVWWLSPHLVTAAACLLFAYGVAWLLAICHRRGVLNGVLMAALFCGAVAAASWHGIVQLPRDLFMIEAGYAILATLTVGAIVGGLYDKLVLPSH